MATRKKIYLKPTAFVGRTEGIYLEKKNISRRIGNSNCFFTQVEILSEGKSKTKAVSIKEFEKDFLNNKYIKSIYNRILSPKKIFLKNKDFLKKQNYIIFGILNVTPDSFSDGGFYFSSEKSKKKAKEMYNDGADFIDVGGESTRPGAEKISSSSEIIRILPVLQSLSSQNIPISLDSRNYTTMKMSNYYGISVFNDVSALKDGKRKIPLIKKSSSMVILMHMPGTPKTMMKRNQYDNVVLDVYNYLEARIEYCEKSGINRDKIIVDPGIGFGKDYSQNIKLLKNLSIFHSLGCPIMLGVSRKRLISKFGKATAPNERLPGSLAIQLKALNEGIQIFRVHDVKETMQAFEAWEATQ